uniref:Uncharacterized protein n=1 Tax=Arundo donax TaxID=35708 RepID=A0A0A9GSP7_ARUDO
MIKHKIQLTRYYRSMSINKFWSARM